MPSFDPSLLPDLGRPRGGLSIDSLRKLKSLEGNLGPVEYDLNLKGLMLQSRINDMLLNGRLRPNGEWNLRATKPMWGGELSFDASPNNYMLRYQRNF